MWQVVRKDKFLKNAEAVCTTRTKAQYKLLLYCIQYKYYLVRITRTTDYKLLDHDGRGKNVGVGEKAHIIVYHNS